MNINKISIPPVDNTSTYPGNSSRWMKWIWLICVIFVVSALGLWYWQKQGPSDSMADWKIYRDDRYSFELKYPPTWTINNLSYTYKNQKTAMVEVSSPITHNLISYEDRGAHYSLSLAFKGGVSVENQGFVAEKLPRDQAVTKINLGEEDLKKTKEYKIAQNIIKSARVTNPKIETIDWKTYSTEVGGFEFKYPPNFNKVYGPKKSDNGKDILFSFSDQLGNAITISLKDIVFDPNNIVGDLGPFKYTDEGVTKVYIGDRVGYQYKIGDGGCVGSVVQGPDGNQTIKVAFSSCYSVDILLEEFFPIHDYQELISKVLESFSFFDKIVYQNRKYGFEFKYPEKWVLEEKSEPDGKYIISILDKGRSFNTDIAGVVTPSLSLMIRKDIYRSDINKYITNQEIKKIVKKEKVSIGGDSAYVVEGITPPVYHDFRVIFRSGFVYDLSYGGSGYDENLRQDIKITFETFLSSFKFIEPTNSLQIYHSSEYGFEFKYPKDWYYKEDKDSNLPLRVFLDPLTTSPNSHVDTDLPYLVTVTVYSNISQLDRKNLQIRSLDDFIQRYSTLEDPEIQNAERVNIGTELGYKGSAGPNVFGGGEYYFVQKGERIFEVWLWNISPSYPSEIALKILSSFKFVSL